ncbi:MAG: ABC-2 transporter permease [Eubacteriales bacterium]|nr:ABC-2 transporter permease [Eubacteriales bacterium]
MRGLIYKDISIFFKSIDKKLILTAAAAIVLLIFNAGIYAGLFASVMFAMTVGMQNIMSFASDEKVSWKKYQLTMPVRSFAVVASKYVSVLYTIAVSVLGSIAFNSLSSLIFHNFDLLIWLFSITAAVIIPLLWTGICLPLTYWFGFRSAQTMGLLAVIPIFYFVKYFEDGPGISAMLNSAYSYMIVAAIAAVIIFGISLVVSTIGYSKKNL